MGECTSPVTIAQLEPGSHTFFVNLVDSHGNFSPVDSYAWTINTEEQGDGSPEHPLSIYDCNGWMNMQNDLGAYYRLANNINCTGITMSPIGNGDTPFTGNLDGNGYTISNVEMTNDGFMGTGLFGELNGATVTALRITDSSFTEGEANGIYGIGALAGVASNSTVGDITSSNLTVITADSSPNYMGGLVGIMIGASVLEKSNFDGVVTNYTGLQNNTGGLVGTMVDSGEVRNSYATGQVNGRNYLGGLIGVMADTSQLKKSYAANTLVSTGNDIGGLVGQLNAGSAVSHAFSVATLSFPQIIPTAGSIVGSSYGAVANSYFITFNNEDPTIFPCVGANGGSIVNCTGEASADYFKGNSSNQPLSSFDDVWNLHETGQLPTFAIGQAVCDDPATQSESTLVFGCDWGRAQKHKYSGNADSREIRYRLRNSSDAWVYQSWPNNTMKVLITGLTPATDYEVQFHAQWEIGRSDWTSSTAWLSTGSDVNLDSDGDGIKDSIEINGPNLGDANGDHTGDIYTNGEDFTQANVTSLRNSITSNYAVLQSDCTSNSAVSMNTESSDYKDAAYDYSLGLMNFTATGCGSIATFTQYFYGDFDASKFIARKYNSNSHSYTTIPGAVLTNVTINGQDALKIVYQIDDNGSFDQNPAVGTITDPSGPAQLSVGVPNTGFGGKR